MYTHKIPLFRISFSRSYKFRVKEGYGKGKVTKIFVE